MQSDSAVTVETELRYIQAVNAALRWSMENVPESIIFGEDVAIPGGPFGSSKGLYEDFGDKRIFDTPISEQGFLGMALGAAMTGLRPIVEIMYVDFAFVGMDQIVNQIATAHYASNGTYRAPLVIRSQQGYSVGSCAQHSHSAEAYFAHTPGLRIAIPSTPNDVYQMLRTAVLSDDPVIVLEARQLYADKGVVELDGPVEKMGGSRVVRPGKDVTIVTWGTMVGKALIAATELSADGVEAEVIDLRWLAPLDMGPVTQSLKQTGRVVIAHEANLTGGFGAEIAARIGEESFGDLRAPVLRIGAPDVHMPAAPALQTAVIPEAADIVRAVRRAMEGDGVVR
jgi:pyruvate/2-oxoglutarate/acetoin dehydrogenase E1 component